jgi:hypothetical protein
MIIDGQAMAPKPTGDTVIPMPKLATKLTQEWILLARDKNN